MTFSDLLFVFLENWNFYGNELHFDHIEADMEDTEGAELFVLQ